MIFIFTNSVKSLESRLYNVEEELKREREERKEAEIGQMEWQEKYLTSQRQ